MKFYDLKVKVKSLVSELGSVNTVLYIMSGLFSRLPVKIYKYYFFAQKLSGNKLLPSHRGKQISVILTPRERILDLPLNRPENVLIDRFEQGSVCLSAFIKGQFAGCLWYVMDNYKEDEVRCLYELNSKNAIFDFDVYVVPKHRLSPVFLRLWEETGMSLLQNKKSWSFSRISAFNPNSISSHKRMGSVKIGWSVFLCIGDSFQLTIANLKPFVHFSVTEFSFPVFKLDIPS